MTERARIGLVVIITFIFILSAGALIPGCRSKKPKKKYARREGTVQAIDLETRRVSIASYVKKLGKTIPITGALAPEAEIYIDGKLSDLSEVGIGDKVIVDGYKYKGQITATRVEIIRKGVSKIKEIKPGAAGARKRDPTN